MTVFIKHMDGRHYVPGMNLWLRSYGDNVYRWYYVKSCRLAANAWRLEVELSP